MPERFSVRKGMPVRRPRSTYPFEEMTNVGDYFDAPDDMGLVWDTESKSARRHSIISSANNYRKRHNASFAVATTIYYDEHKKPWVRCQRIAAGSRKGSVFKVQRADPD